MENVFTGDKKLYVPVGSDASCETGEGVECAQKKADSQGETGRDRNESDGNAATEQSDNRLIPIGKVINSQNTPKCHSGNVQGDKVTSTKGDMVIQDSQSPKQIHLTHMTSNRTQSRDRLTSETPK